VFVGDADGALQFGVVHVSVTLDLSQGCPTADFHHGSQRHAIAIITVDPVCRNT
jgi:hypothetical protein